MNKIFIVLFAVSITTVISQSCSNSLASYLEIPNLQTITNETTGLLYCKSLKNSDSCCSATTINGFQKRADELIERLTTLVSKRDISWIQKRNDILKHRETYDRLGIAAERARNTIEAQGNYSRDRDSPSGYAHIAGYIFWRANSVIENITDIQSNFTLYQEKRRECIIEMVKTQAAAWCLACDPYVGSKGLSGGILNFSDELQNRIISSCSEFIDLAFYQDLILSLHYMRAGLSGMIDGLGKIINGDFEGGVETFSLAMNASFSLNPPPDEEKTIRHIWCSPYACPWIFTDLFYNGKINETLLAAGGEIISATRANQIFGRVSIRIKERDNKDAFENIVNRKLSGGGWSPDVDEAGVDVEFSVNPGRVDNYNLSGFRNGLVGFSLTVFAFLFF